MLGNTWIGILGVFAVFHILSWLQMERDFRRNGEETTKNWKFAGRWGLNSQNGDVHLQTWEFEQKTGDIKVWWCWGCVVFTEHEVEKYHLNLEQSYRRAHSPKMAGD
jgi:hypothetical protein